MPAMTYNSLLEDLRRYLERGNVTDVTVFAQLPSLVGLAERDIATKLKILGFVNVVTSSMTAGVPVLDKPDRWRETASFNFGVGSDPLQERTPLFPRALEYCTTYWPNRILTAQPRFYADYDYQHWLVAPTPDQSYPFEVNYWQLPPLLDVGNQTNWLTDYAPNALLYGALLQCTPFLKDDARIATWKDFYVDQLGSLDGQDLQRILDRQVVRQEV